MSKDPWDLTGKFTNLLLWVALVGVFAFGISSCINNWMEIL